MTPPCVAQSLIVRNAIDKGSFRALAAKARKRPPDGECDFLKQILAQGDDRLITGSQTRQGRAIFAQDAVKVIVLSRGYSPASDVFVIPAETESASDDDLFVLQQTGRGLEAYDCQRN